MDRLNCDVLVVGGGAAGARAAYAAKQAHPELDVLLAVAGQFGASGSSNLMASESLGINAPFNSMADGDSPDVFYDDIIKTGLGLADPALCRIIADEAGPRVQELIDLGLKFDTTADGHLLQHKLSGCTKARSLTCGGSTGQAMVRVLKEGMARLGCRVLEGVRVLDLAQDASGRVIGAAALKDDEPLSIDAKAVVLATGGAGRIFKKNVNPPTVEGDGWCLAYRAGAALVNMEFYQIGPAVFQPAMQFIIHSHMWRLKPKLTNALGEEFLPRYCPPGVDPAEVMVLKAMSYPFSVRTAAMYLDIAIHQEVMAGRGTAGGGIYLDVTHVGEATLRQKAPLTYEHIKKAGADLARERIEIGMVLQNFNGGIRIDAHGATSVPGLFAAGEVSGGVHGADRPGGNNLTDTQVFGHRAGQAAAEFAAKASAPAAAAQPAAALAPLTAAEGELIERSAALFYANLTVVRTKQGLEEVLAFTAAHRHHQNRQVANRLLLGSILATAEMARQESRGTHYREDCPATDPAWAKRIAIARGREGEPVATILP